MTICSYDNSGQLKFDVDIEMAQGYWNTSSSRLWTRIRDLMHDDLVAKYNDMRQNGLSYESLMQCFYDEQIAKIPQKYYNMDYDIKYAPFSDSYLGMANGDTYEHLKRWLKNRLIFVDTLYDYAPSYNNDVLTIRANTTEPMTIYIETYTPVYQHLSWYNGQMDKKKIDGKIAVEFTGTAMAATDQEVLIYGGANVKKITGISSMNPNRMLIGSATRLIELDAHDCPLLSDINANKSNLAPHVYLNKVNLSGCPLLGGNLIINNSPLVREIDIRGTGIVGLNLPSNLRNLEVLKLPSAIKTLNLNDAGQLHTLEFDPGSKMETVSMTNCNALTNVVNFDLENVANVTLNNSYNITNELYFSKTTNLSLRNMSNLERVIYLPNAEYEVFDKTNVDNASDYKVSVFNSPKCNTFMVTAPYRESYNVCGMKDKEVLDYDNLVNIMPDGEPLNAMVDSSTGTVTSSTTGIHYTTQDYIEVLGGVSITINISFSSSILSIAFYDESKSYISGDYRTSWTEYTFSTPTNCHYIRFHAHGSSNNFKTIELWSPSVSKIQVKDYGDIQPNTTFTANSIDISSTQFTDVKLLATTDTNVLKLPQTAKNLIVDSAYDLDTDYLEDGEYDVVHGELVEQYTEDWNEEVGVPRQLTKVITKDDLVREEPGVPTLWYAPDIEVVPGFMIYFQASLSNSYTSLQGIASDGVTVLETFIPYSTLVYAGDVLRWWPKSDVRYLRLRTMKNSECEYTIDYGAHKVPNIIPSASDGSLIFSMYAPSNTAQPASGVWDLKGLEFDNFYTYGMNNDVKLVYDEQEIIQIQMPKRDADYEVTIENANINPKDLPTMLYPKLVDTESPIKGEVDYSEYEGTSLDWAVAYTNKNEVDITIPDEVLLNSTSQYNINKDSEYKIIDPRTICIMTVNQSGKTPWLTKNSARYTNCYHTEVNNGDGTYTVTTIANSADDMPEAITFGSVDYVGTVLISLDYINVSNVTNMSNMFLNCNNLTNLDLSGWDTSKVTSMYSMFNGCSKLTSLNLSGFDTTKVTNMSNMFLNCEKLTNLDLSGWDTSNVTNMANMFRSCSAITSLDLSSFNTKEVTDMGSMFQDCTALTTLDLSNFDTSNITNMGYMFQNCNTLTSLDLSSFDTSKVTTMNLMFINCKKLTQLDLSSFDTKEVKDMSVMFQGCTSLEHIIGLDTLDTSNVTNMSYMFFNCNALTSLDLSSFDTSNVTNMGSMFFNCNKLLSLDVSNFNTSNVTFMANMFNGCSSLTSLDLSSFNTSKVTNTNNMLTYCNALMSLNVTGWPLNDYTQTAISTLPEGNDAKNEIEATVYFTVPSGWTIINPLDILSYTTNATGVEPTFNSGFSGYSVNETDNGDGTYSVKIATDSLDNLPTSISFKGKTSLLTVKKINTSKVTTMADMFNGCTNLTSLDLSSFNTSKVTNMNGMFSGCSALTSLDLSSFDTSSVTTMSGIFEYCNALTSLNLSSFNTSSVTNMSFMFCNCNKLTSLDLSNFDTKEVMGMADMFNGCSSLTSLNVSNFNTSKVYNMSYMFSRCSNLTSLDLSNFDTSNVESMSGMFNACNNLTSLNLSSFNTSKVTNMNHMFTNCWDLCSLVSMQNISSSLDLSRTKLDADSILDIIANLVVVTDTKTLTLPTVELVEGAILIATNKGWEVVGDITIAEPDEGGDNEEGSITLSQDTLTFNIIGENRILTADITGSIIGEDITWQSNNENIAKVSGYTSTSGIVTSKGNGECTITAICGDYSATCSVIVNSTNTGDGGDSGNTGDGGDGGDGENNIACTSIYITPEAYTFTSIAQEYELSVNITPSNTTDEIFWSTSNGAIAQVVNGTVTSVGNGECIITATCGDYSATCLITVSDDTTNDAILTDFTLNADFNVTSKNYYRVECTPIPSSLIGVGTVWWSSSDPAVLGTSSTQGDSMTFIPGRSGTCTITVTYDAGSQGYLRKKYTATVTIPDETRNVEILYDNPTITIENLKAKAVQGTAVQYFDVSYEINDGHPSYNSSLELYDNEGNKYYLALTNKGTSPFGKNNLHLDSAGWYTESSETSGVFYKMQASVIYWNNFNLNLTVRNKDNSVHDELLSKALFNFNQTLPALNMVVDNSSSNTIQLADLEDSWLGLCGKYADSMNFYITLNNTAMTKNYGLYSASNNRWLSTTVHELGHTLGTSDSCAHHPSMYTYTRDTSKCVYLQPNDIAWIEYLHKEMYGIDLITTQENINAQVSSLDLNAIEINDEDEMHFEYGYTIPDVVVECELEYVETTHLNISKESEFYMEYDIYEIVNETVVGGDLTNKQLKLPVGQKINVDTSKRYRLSLIKYETAPCSLVNPDAMIIIGGK